MNEPKQMTDEELMEMFGGFASGAVLNTPSTVDVSVVYGIDPCNGNSRILPPVIYGSIPAK